MRKSSLAMFAAGLCTFALAAPMLAATMPATAAAAPPSIIPELAWQRFTLPNGLTVVVHEDHKAPVVAVSVWYHVGSSYEPRGRPASRICSST